MTDGPGEYGGPQWLAQMLTAWLASPHTPKPAAGDPAGPAVVLELRLPDGRPIGYAGLPAAAVRAIGNALNGDLRDYQRAAASYERMERIGDLLAEAWRASEDVGDLLVAALGWASRRVYLGPVGLTLGRPGSWEAVAVREWAAAGQRMLDQGAGPLVERARFRELADLFEAMGDARDDGGDVVSRALGRAADAVGGARRLVGSSSRLAAYPGMVGQYAQDSDAAAN